MKKKEDIKPMIPMTLAEQVAHARKEYNSWSKEKRESMVLEGPIEFFYKQQQ